MENQESFNNASPVIPAPPEMKVRTMKSDREMIARGGGAFAASYAGDISEGLRTEGPLPSMFPKHPEAYKEPFLSFVRPSVVIVFGIIALLAILGFLIYRFLLPAIKNGLFSRTQNSTSSLVFPNQIEPVSDASNHASFFRLPTDEALEVSLSAGPVSDVSDLQTYGQKLAAVTQLTSRTGGFFEVYINRSDGVLLAIGSFLNLIDARVFDDEFLIKNFSPDFTAFAHKDKNGLWPGYVIKLQKGENQLFLQKDIAAQIENSPYLLNFFVAPSGLINGGFKDMVIGGRPARYAVFTSGAEFAYSWFNASLLVISTSRAGLEKSFEYLGR